MSILPNTFLLFWIRYCCVLTVGVFSQTGAAGTEQITQPPPVLELDPFYQKYLDCEGIPVISSERVSDQALYRVQALLNQALATRPDVRARMVEAGVRYIIIGQYELVTDIPEYSDYTPKDYVNERVRGYGGVHTSCGEENVLSLYNDRYEDESIFIHELAHAIHLYGLRHVDKGFQDRLDSLYETAMAKGLYKDDYASTNSTEYWAEAVQAYFECDRENNWNHNHINTREELYDYDPDVADLVRDSFHLTDETDWHYVPVSKQPSVIEPPILYQGVPMAKYVWCRSFEIVGPVHIGDATLLRADQIVRNMFRYRHDILKAMIDRDLRLIVTPDGRVPQHVAPEQVFDPTVLVSKIQNDPKTLPPQWLYMVLSADDVGAGAQSTGEIPLVAQIALATYLYTGLREPIPGYNDRGPKKLQQYEIRLRRLDRVELDKKATALYQAAMDKQLWQDTIVAADRFHYFAYGVQAFFDAAYLQVGAGRTIRTREDLEKYDPALCALIAEIFKHPDRYDWRASYL